ncbi:hypothetical protein SDC9_158247 [bioreactor metagenome]|uniref:Uncharacterized protein n=1 Tax=bioreactor metagenome TaxID=1076179 RepID=A0A645FC78_9ZZZZ
MKISVQTHIPTNQATKIGEMAAVAAGADGITSPAAGNSTMFVTPVMTTGADTTLVAVCAKSSCLTSLSPV